jgi:hypothetical protein
VDVTLDWNNNHRSGYDATLDAFLERMRGKPADIKWNQTAMLVAEIDRLRAEVDRLRGQQCAC